MFVHPNIKQSLLLYNLLSFSSEVLTNIKGVSYYLGKVIMDNIISPFSAQRDRNRLLLLQYSSQAAAPLLMIFVGYLGIEGQGCFSRTSYTVPTSETEEKMYFPYWSAMNHSMSDILPPAVTPHPTVQTSPHSSTSTIVQWHRRGKIILS